MTAEAKIAEHNAHLAMKPQRFQHRLDQFIGTAMQARDVAGQEAANVLAVATEQLRRAMKRAEALADDWQRISIPQHFGPTVEFTGRLISDTSFNDRREGRSVTLELYETQAGAMIAVCAFELRDGAEAEMATVVSPTGDVQADRFAVMEAFKWRDEAKKMVRKKLGWDLRVEIA